MLSSLTVRGGEMTMRALEVGAFDFLTKPEGGSAETNRGLLRARLLPMIRAFERRREIRAILSGAASRARVLPQPAGAVRRPPRFVSPARRSRAIGSAPGADWRFDRRSRRLAKLMPALPGDLGAPVFIVQHMPAMFTQPLAQAWKRRAPSGSRKRRMARPPNPTAPTWRPADGR